MSYGLILLWCDIGLGWHLKKNPNSSRATFGYTRPGSNAVPQSFIANLSRNIADPRSEQKSSGLPPILRNDIHTSADPAKFESLETESACLSEYL